MASFRAFLLCQSWIPPKGFREQGKHCRLFQGTRDHLPLFSENKPLREHGIIYDRKHGNKKIILGNLKIEENTDYTITNTIQVESLGVKTNFNIYR